MKQLYSNKDLFLKKKEKKLIDNEKEKENIGSILFDIGLSNILEDLSSQARATKAK